MRTWVDAAQLVRTRNLDGSFAVRCTARLPFLLSAGMEVALVPPQEDLPRRVHVAACDDEGAGMGVVRFAEVSDVECARALVGLHCLVKREALPEAAAGVAAAIAAVGGAGLVGWAVRDAREGLLGTVAGIEEKPAQSLLSVACPDGATLLIPLVDEFIASIDEDAREITMELPVGLTQLRV